ncbi:MAG: glycosyl transferase family 1 [Sedimenticola sp.]|nr:MAG: glycosyl transferase family 1 [Sedimenticola sp.]
MKILMISDVYFPRVNGVSTSILTFTRSFIEQGHEVTLIAPDYPDVGEHEFEILRIPSCQVPLDPEDRFMHRRHIRRLLPELRRRDFNILHIHTPFVAHYAGTWLGKRLGVPVVVSYHTFFEAYLEKYIPWMPHSWLRALARSFSRNQCNAVDGVVSPSKQMLARLREYGVTRQAHVIPTGLDLEQFRGRASNTFRQRHDIPGDAFLCLYLGRVAHEKNIDFLIEMFEFLKHDIDRARLVIAGEGPALPGLKKQVQRLGMDDSVHFIGYLKPIEAVVDCYRASDVFVFASETETQGLVLLEAMACGTPVVSCACLGSEDVLKDGEGCLISSLDWQLFADRVIALANDDERRRQLSTAGLEYVRDWSTEAKSAEMLDFYCRVIDRRASLGQHEETDSYDSLDQQEMQP